MKHIILPLSAVLTLTFSSCSIDINGKKGLDLVESTFDSNTSIVHEDRKISNFDNVDISSAFSVVVSDNDYKGSIVVSAPDYAMDKIVTKVVNGTLKVYVDGSISMKSGDKLEITFPHRKLRDIKISGASKLIVKHVMKLEKLNVNLSGASSLDLNVVSNLIKLDHSGASKFKLTGNTQDFEANVSGASKLDAENLKASKVILKASGASSAKVWAVNDLKINASGASKVVYKSQNGLVKSLDKSGASKISEF